MKLIIDTEVIKDLVENEWGYEGIRDDLDEIFEKHGTPLDNLIAEIDEQYKWLLKSGCDAYKIDIAFGAIKAALRNEVNE